jgi:glucosamine--fructose-6-phosphate aminotransferase (isomerizing)
LTTPDTLDATGSQTWAEVVSQPEIWAQLLDRADELIAPLPKAGEPVLFVGCGTSYYVGESYARRRNAAGLGRTRAAIASEIPYIDPQESVVVLSRSGTTTDVIRVVESLRGRQRVVGIVGEPGTPISQICDEVVLMDFADETSVVQTRFATTAVALLRASLGEDLSHLPDAARSAFDLPLPDELPAHSVFLGSGWTIGLAHEAALKCREAAGAWTEAYPLMEYQHGPIAVAGPRSLVWSLTPTPDFVVEAIEETGAQVLVPELDPLAQLVAVHRLALRLAASAGRDPDRPQHLSRSVRLD